MESRVISPADLIFPDESVALRTAPKETDKDWDDFLRFEKDVAFRGLLNPFSVREEDGKYMVVDGSRRATAVKRLHESKGLFSEITVIIRNEDEYDAMASQIAGNFQAKKTPSIKEIRALKIIAAKKNLTITDLANMVGMTELYVQKLLKLTGLPEAAQEAINDKKMSSSNAITLQTLPADVIEEYIADACVKTGEEFTAIVAERLEEEKKVREKGTAEFTVKAKLKSKIDLEVLLEQAETIYEKDDSEFNRGQLEMIKTVFELDEQTISAKRLAFDEKIANREVEKENRKKQRDEQKEADMVQYLISKGHNVTPAAKVEQ